MFEITKKTVVASDGCFEEHPESYSPRIFIETCSNAEEYLRQGGADIVTPIWQVYELLANGQAILQPSFPEDLGFDYWRLYTPTLGQINMIRAVPRVLPTEVEVQGKKFPLFVFPKDLRAAVRIIDTNDTSAVSQADGDCPNPDVCGCGKLGNPSLDHLPEGSH